MADTASPGAAFVYTTNEFLPGAVWNVPSWLTNIPTGTTPARAFAHDAMPTLPVASYGNIWSPTVVPAAGGYLMLFSEGIAGRADCIGAAQGDGVTFTPINTWTFCSGTISTGMLDPSLFVDPSTGFYWMLYSQQWGPNGGSEIDAVRIDPIGIMSGADNCGFPAPDCGMLSPIYTLVTYGQVASLNSSPGPNAMIEGPNMTADRYNGYDLTFSLGTWTAPGTYETGEIACLDAYGACLPAKAAIIMADGDPRDGLSGPGGASTLSSQTPNNNYLIWHSYATSSGGNRIDWVGPTSDYDDNSAASASEKDLSTQTAEATPITLAREHPVAVPYHWQPRVAIPQYAGEVIGAPDPPSKTTTPT